MAEDGVRGGGAHVEATEGLAIRVEGVVVELDELLCGARVSSASLPSFLLPPPSRLSRLSRQFLTGNVLEIYSRPIQLATALDLFSHGRLLRREAGRGKVG